MGTSRAKIHMNSNEKGMPSIVRMTFAAIMGTDTNSACAILASAVSCIYRSTGKEINASHALSFDRVPVLSPSEIPHAM